MRAAFEFADIFFFFAEHRLVFTELIRNRLVTFFDLFNFAFGFGKFRIAVLGLRRRFNSVLRVRHFAIELVQATGAVFNRIPVNADRSIATTQ